MCDKHPRALETVGRDVVTPGDYRETLKRGLTPCKKPLRLGSLLTKGYPCQG